MCRAYTTSYLCGCENVIFITEHCPHQCLNPTKPDEIEFSYRYCRMSSCVKSREHYKDTIQKMIEDLLPENDDSNMSDTNTELNPEEQGKLRFIITPDERACDKWEESKAGESSDGTVAQKVWILHS